MPTPCTKTNFNPHSRSSDKDKDSEDEDAEARKKRRDDIHTYRIEWIDSKRLRLDKTERRAGEAFEDCHQCEIYNCKLIFNKKKNQSYISIIDRKWEPD